MTPPETDPAYRIRISFGARGVIGPGKAELLARIAETGSIAAAGRGMGMSYKRAWQLVEAMNAMFLAPVVETARGGAKGGGARLTETGQTVLSEYRAIEDRARQAGAPHLAALIGLMRDMPDGK
ncbi:molybdate transport system regulatory protein [Paracoccus isoporae]|uniref:Molybdate transport system regulatory protein n=1 Tax=Paracoccus isoporae TaxID=591205 RepID=A0A1G6WIB0_9RHOB|nr:LysR family transcriptional regulator [Paracoccus isoporae]SDD64815.1 molybdate transport system regulatory protein [Paracoccus isoporae]